MRRSTLAVLATVSLAALVSVATTSEAVQPPSVILGVLKPVEDWKVGTVKVTGASFCAMVNKFDKGIGLAFARSPEGYGTVAMDVRQNVFTPNNTYEVQLKAAGGVARKMQGKATSARSIVLQVGQDKALYDALNGNGTMQISMPAVDISFALAKFSNSFKSLVTCANKLNAKAESKSADGTPKMPAAKVADVEQASLAPIDREVQKLSSGAKTQVAANDAPTSLDAQLDAAANAEVKVAQTNIAKLEEQRKEVVTQIDAGRQQAAQIAEQKQVVERKLLASAHTETPAVPPANTGATAKLWDDQQVVAAAKRAEEQAKIQQGVEAKNAEIAKLEAAKAEAARQQVAEAAARQQALAQKAAEIQKQRDAIAAKQAVADSKPLKATLVAKEAQLASVDVQAAQERSLLAQKLAATQSDFQSKVATLTAERDSLKVQLAAAQAEAAKWQQADAADRAQAQALQAKLAQSDSARQTLEARIAQLEAQGKVLAKAAPAFPANNSELTALRAELAGLKAKDAAQLAAVEEKLSDKSAQFDALKGQYDALRRQGGTQTAADATLAKRHEELAGQLTQKQAEIDRLQQKLAQIESDRAAEAGRVKVAQADLADQRAVLSGVRKSLVVINDGVESGLNAPIPLAKNAELERAQAELADMRQKNAALSEKLALAATKADALPIVAPVDKKAEAELAELRRRNAELSSQLAAASTKPAVQPGPNPELEKAQAELAELKTRNAELTDKLAVAVQPAAGPDKNEAELADLRAKNAQLQQRLATIISSQPAPIPSPLAAAKAQAQEQNRAKLAAAQNEINALRNAKLELEQSLSQAVAAPVPAVTEDPVPPPSSARAMARVQPSSGGDSVPLEAALAPQRAPGGWTNGKGGFISASRPAAAPATEEAAAAPDPSFDENRAAAFLDRIMSYHRPAGSTETPSAPAVADAAPVFGQAMTAEEAEAPVPALLPRRKPQRQVVAAAPAPAPAARNTRMTAMPDDEQQFAAPAAAPAPVASAPLWPSEQAAAEPAPVRVMARAPRVAAAPVVPLSGGSPVTLEGLLSNSGVDAAFKPASGGDVRQWSSGAVNGMYEQLPAGNFRTQAQNYLGRYKQDCPGGLDVKMGQPQTTEAGTFAEANVTCNLESNRYSTSFVFVQDARKFGAILHTGYPEDAAKIRSIGDNIAYALGSSGGLLPLSQSSARTADASAAQAAPARRRFTIRDEAPAPAYSAPAAVEPAAIEPAAGTPSYGGGFAGNDEPETVVVE
ncbi:MAG: hypothetical protein EPN97_11055 [Alphaproteobacteria bacterium]|nr:MAG: hypothetical protein EPN97_11055 [Alphaproteobacteria bacterium]